MYSDLDPVHLTIPCLDIPFSVLEQIYLPSGSVRSYAFSFFIYAHLGTGA